MLYAQLLAGCQARRCERRLPAGDDLHDLQPVARLELALGELRRGYSFAIMLHHHAARQELLCDQKVLDGAGKLALDLLAVGDDKAMVRG